MPDFDFIRIQKSFKSIRSFLGVPFKIIKFLYY